MSHEVESLAFIEGVHPWHGIGELISDASDSVEVMEKAKLANWNLVKVPLGYPASIDLWDWKAPETEEGQEPLPFPEEWPAVHAAGMFGILRTKDRRMLSSYSVREDYRIIQNEEIFGVLDQFKAEIEYRVAGSLRRGQRVFILCQFKNSISEGIQVRPDDPGSRIVPYLLAHTNHAGEGSLIFDLTMIEVVCMNTLNAAEMDAWTPIRILHRKNATERMEEAAQSLIRCKEQFAEIADAYREMAVMPCTMDQWNRILRRTLQIHQDKDSELIPPITKRRMNKLTDLFSGGQGRRGETMWDAYGAFTEYLSHFRGNESQMRTGSAESMWFGSSREMERRALKSIQAETDLYDDLVSD